MVVNGSFIDSIKSKGNTKGYNEKFISFLLLFSQQSTPERQRPVSCVQGRF